MGGEMEPGRLASGAAGSKCRGMTLPDDVREFLTSTPAGVLATVRPDGTVRQSVVYHLLEGDTVQVSTLAGRGKARDVERTGRASLCVVGPELPYPSVTVEGAATIRREDIGETTNRIFRVFRGPDFEAMSDEQLAEMGRVLIEICIDRHYGASYLDRR